MNIFIKNALDTLIETNILLIQQVHLTIIIYVETFIRIYLYLNKSLTNVMSRVYLVIGETIV